jgi:lactoylglutathione lyase
MMTQAVLQATVLATLAIAASAQTPPAPVRPRIVGVAHIGLRTDDLDAARNFYGHQLGFEEAFKLDRPKGGLMLVYFKVNDHQYIEVFPGRKGPEQLVFSHVAFETDNAQQLRD